MTTERATGRVTRMVHFECHTCHMTATCVVTPASELAWMDHMDTHSAIDNFSMWGWEVLELPFDQTATPK